LEFFEVINCEDGSEFGFHENCYVKIIVNDLVYYIIELFAIVDTFYIYSCDFPDIHEKEELSCSSMGVLVSLWSLLLGVLVETLLVMVVSGTWSTCSVLSMDRILSMLFSKANILSVAC
jgi:hypothetical protein